MKNFGKPTIYAFAKHLNARKCQQCIAWFGQTEELKTIALLSESKGQVVNLGYTARLHFRRSQEMIRASPRQSFTANHRSEARGKVARLERLSPRTCDGPAFLRKSYKRYPSCPSCCSGDKLKALRYNWERAERFGYEGLAREMKRKGLKFGANGYRPERGNLVK